MSKLEQETTPRSLFAIETLTINDSEIIFVDIEHEDETKLPSDWLEKVRQSTTDFGPNDLFMVEYYPPDFSSLLSKIPGLNEIVSNYIDQKIGPSYHHIFELAKEKKSLIAVADIANNLIYTIYELLSQIPYNFNLAIKNLPMLIQNFRNLEEAIELIMKSEGVYSDFPSNIEPLHAVDARRFYTAWNLFQSIRSNPNKKIVVVNAPAHNRRVREYLKKFENGNKMQLRFAIYGIMLGIQRKMREYHTDI
jgi:hypothetical protein